MSESAEAPDASRSTESGRDDSTQSTDRTLSVSIVNRLRNTRWVSVFFMIAALGPVFVGLASVGAWRLARAPERGFSFGSFSGRVTMVRSDWTKLSQGDVIVAVDGERVDGDPRLIRRATLALEPGPVTFTFARDGEEIVVRHVLVPAGILEQISVWTRVATGTILLLIGLGAFLMRPGTRVAWLFLAFSTALAIHLLGYLAFISDPPAGLILEALGQYWAGAFGIHLFLVYPGEVLTRRRALLVTLYSLAAVLIVPSFFYEYPRAYGIAAASIRLAAPWGAIMSGTAIALVVWQFVRAKNDEPIARARAMALLIGVILGLAIPAILGLILSSYSEYGWTFASFLVIVFAMLTAWSIVRHNALEVDRFTAAVLGYLATTAGIVVVFGILLVGLTKLVETTGVLRSPVTSAIVTAAFFLAFNPVYRGVRSRVDRLFRRESLGEDAVLGLLHDLANSVRTSKLTVTSDKALQAALSLGSEHCAFWIKQRDDRFVSSRTAGARSDDSVDDPLEPGSPLLAAVRRGSGGVVDLVDHVFESPAQTELWERGYAFAAPVFVGEELRAFLAVSRKSNGTEFTRRERSLLDTVASHVGIAIEYHEAEEKRRFGPYRTIRRLGTGGMAEVFLAGKRGPGGFELRVALKRLLPHLAEDPDAVKMVLDEARIAARLDHPNIVKIFDVSEHGGSYWLAMELLDGPHLGRMIRSANQRGTLLPLPVVSYVARAMLGALSHAHAATDDEGRPMRIVHRDVKPGNILTNRRGEIKLADFGIARAESRLYRTKSGVVRGTPAYMAPEQRLGYNVGPAADLWAAGAVLYETLTGVGVPAESQFGHDLHPPSSLRPDLPRELDDILKRALEHDPQDRYASADELLAAFLAGLGGVTPVSAEELAHLIEEIDGGEAVHEDSTERRQPKTIDLGGRKR